MLPDSTNPRVMADNIKMLAASGGGGTTVVANPEGEASGVLSSLGIDDEKFTIPVYTPVDYSTSEHALGINWVNGDPLYEKTFVVSAHTFAAGSNDVTLEENTEITLSNIKNIDFEVIRASGVDIKSSSLTDIAIIKSSNDLKLYVEVSGSSYGTGDIILTIRYTKE